jgi:hypothetical protein
MSTSNPFSLPTQPPRSFWRSWRFLLLTLVLLAGGAYWWSKRLTPEEQFLLGRWSVTVQETDGSQNRFDWDLRSDRRVASNGSWWYWTANGDRFTAREQIPAHEALRRWANTGFKSWPHEPPMDAQLEIINSHEARITPIDRSTGQDGARAYLRRVPPK